MPGVNPKLDADRRRSNASDAFLTLAPRVGEPPPLPAREGGSGWSPRVLDWWDAAWRSEIASQWLPVDYPSIERYVEAWQVWLDFLSWDGEPVPAPSAVLSAMAVLEDRLGLSPVARRKLRWAVDPSGPESVVAGMPRRRRPADPRLRAVK